MRLRGLDLNLLVALDAVLAERHISRAAQRVHLSQPAMSNALLRLRRYFDDQLVVRSGRTLVLTARAEALIEPVREVLLRVENTIASPPRFDPATATRLFTIAVSDFSASVLIQPLVARLYRIAPRVGLQLLQHAGASPLELLTQARADVLVLPQQFLAAAQPSVRLFDERYVCVTWRGSRRWRSGVTLKQYQAAGHVETQFGLPGFRGFDAHAIEALGLTRRAEIIAPNLSLQAQLVIGTDRIATMHERLARRAARHLPIRIHKVPFRIPVLTEFAQWNAARNEDPGLQWLIQRCIEVARDV